MLVVPKRSSQHGGAGLSRVLCFHGARAPCRAASLDSIGKRAGHAHGILGQGHCRVQEDAVVAPFHDLAGVGRQPQAGIDQQRYLQSFAQGL